MTHKLHQWMTYFLLEDDRSRDWTISELIENSEMVRPEIRRYILAYHIGGFDLVFKLYRKEIYQELGIEYE